MRFDNIFPVLIGAFILLFSKLSLASNDAKTGLIHLDRFRFKNLNDGGPPCPSYDCQLAWAAVPMALGDPGEYARRMSAYGMSEYAKAKGISQDFKILKNLEGLGKSDPYHIDKIFVVPIKNSNSTRYKLPLQTDSSLDIRPIVESAINGVRADLLIDTAGTLSVNENSSAAGTLVRMNIEANSETGLGIRTPIVLSLASSVDIGASRIKDILALLNNSNTTGDPKHQVGTVGYDLLLRFSIVHLDFRAGVVKFNSQYSSSNCVSMTLAVDKNMLVSGIVAPVIVEGQMLLAKIDTGANVDLMIHGASALSNTKFSPLLHRKALDRSGNLVALEHAIVDVQLGKNMSRNVALRGPIRYGDFDVTLGTRFFAGQRLILDFDAHRLCLD